MDTMCKHINSYTGNHVITYAHGMANVQHFLTEIEISVVGPKDFHDKVAQAGQVLSL